MASCEWPSRSETTFRSTPADRARLALVWRRSWSRMTGRPAFRANAWKCLVAYSGRTLEVLGLSLSAEHGHGLGVDGDEALSAFDLHPRGRSPGECLFVIQQITDVNGRSMVSTTSSQRRPTVSPRRMPVTSIRW